MCVCVYVCVFTDLARKNVLVSLVNGISTFMSYLMPKPVL